MISSISALLRSNTIHSALVCTSTEAHHQLLLLVIKGTIVKLENLKVGRCRCIHVLIMH